MILSDSFGQAVVSDGEIMMRAVARAKHSRLLAPPNPWVGAVLVAANGVSYEAGTQRPGGRHAERVVIDRAGEAARGATLYSTLEPCSHFGRTSPCSVAIVDAGIKRVVVGVEDPDKNVAGSGIAELRRAGIDVAVGAAAAEIEAQLAPYLHHRRTGKPWVVLKLASTLDGRTAAADGTSKWITGAEARLDAHGLRAGSDAILVGAGTVRDDDPSLTVRGIIASDGRAPREPLRVVLGKAGAQSKIQPCQEMAGELGDVVGDLGRQGIVQLMVEGGASVAGAFHQAGLVDQYVIYLAPALMGGSNGRPVFEGAGAAGIGQMLRSKFASVSQIGNDLRIELLAGQSTEPVSLPGNPNT